VVGRQKADIADTLHLRNVVMATTLAFCIWGAHWRHLANTTEPSMCGGDAALCQIILTTCLILCAFTCLLSKISWHWIAYSVLMCHLETTDTPHYYYDHYRYYYYSRRLLYFGRVLSFFPTIDFSTSQADFRETLPHDAMCSEIFYLLYGCSYVPLKIWGQKTQFLPICGPKIDTLSPAIS